MTPVLGSTPLCQPGGSTGGPLISSPPPVRVGPAATPARGGSCGTGPEPAGVKGTDQAAGSKAARPSGGEVTSGAAPDEGVQAADEVAAGANGAAADEGVQAADAGWTSAPPGCAARPTCAAMRAAEAARVAAAS